MNAAATSVPLDSSPMRSERVVAERIGCALDTIRKSRQSGRLYGIEAPPFIKLGRRVFYRDHDIDAWLAEHGMVAKHCAQVAAARGYTASQAQRRTSQPAES